MKTSIAPRFNGHFVFGVQDRFVCTPMVCGGASIDFWLGNTLGTTTGPPQQCWGLSGLITGPTSAAVTTSLATLAGLAGIDSEFGFPTGSRLPGVNFFWTPRPCYFRPPELITGVVTPMPGNVYGATFRMIMRMCS